MKKFIFLISAIIGIIYSSVGHAQQITQKIHGRVIDIVTNEPIPFATIQMADDESLGCVSDSLGRFELKGISVGRHSLKCKYLGYEPLEVNDVLVTSAKEAIVDFKMRERANNIGGVIVRPKLIKENTLNNMVLTGGRMFSIEEASRYAGGFDDPARLATSFAGVATGGATNGISIHGNAPHLLAWHLEDIEIPNPNHFSDISVLGGGIFSSLSAMCIGNSDFLTAAFPAEFSNAVSGVFDMKMRNGNDQTHEHTIQVGVAGIDIASEGPLNKKTGASYLINYRYSMTGLASKMNLIDMQGQVMDYQDLNFKINLPTPKAGTFSLWGTGLIDKFYRDPIPNEWETKDEECYSESNQIMGAFGLSHILPMKYGQLKSSIGYTYSRDKMLADTYNLPDDFDFSLEKLPDSITSSPYFRAERTYANLTARTTYTHRHSTKWIAQYGGSFTLMMFDVNLREAYAAKMELHQICKNDGNTNLVSAFTNHSLTLAPRTTLNAGINFQHLTLNKETTIEPRVSLKQKFSERFFASFAYGLHSRAEKLDIYFTRKLNDPMESGDWSNNNQGTDELVNKDLGFTKSHHFMMTFGYKFSDVWNLKVEPYYQYLFNIPVEDGKEYSVLNRQEFYLDKALVNKGKGRNYGVDITLERFINRGWYGMLNGSFFSSRYLGGDNKWRHTLFDRNYIINILGGKEWMLGKSHNNMLSVNLKATLQGGDRYTPYDREKTLAHPDFNVKYKSEEAYSLHHSPMLIIHYTISYKMNRKGLTHEFSIKHVNCTGTNNYYGYEYCYRKDEFKESSFNFSLPNISYKIEF